ncbi:unnamed protein product [Aphanomyces euteiches]
MFLSLSACFANVERRGVLGELVVDALTGDDMLCSSSFFLNPGKGGVRASIRGWGPRKLSNWRRNYSCSVLKLDS